MAIFIGDYGRGLPDDFLDNMNDLFDEPPAGIQVGGLVKDYSREIAVRLVRFGDISVAVNTGQGMMFETGRKTFAGLATDGANAPQRGQSDITVTVGSGNTVAKDDFARGILLITSGNVAPHRLYIVGNTAKDASHRVTLSLEKTLPADMATTDKVKLIAHKFMNVVPGQNSNAATAKIIPVGACLTRSPDDYKYAYVQCGGIGVSKAEVAIAASVQDGTPLIKGNNGGLKLQADTDLKPVVASLISQGDAIVANELIPVEFTLGFEF